MPRKGQTGGHPSEAARKKMSEAQLRRWAMVSPEERRKIGHRQTEINLRLAAERSEPRHWKIKVPHTEEHRRKISTAQKARWVKDHDRLSEAVARGARRPEVRRQRSDRMKARISNDPAFLQRITRLAHSPDASRKVSAKAIARFNGPRGSALREAMSVRTEMAWKDPAFAEGMKAAFEKRGENPEWRRKLSESGIRRMADPPTRKRVLDAISLAMKKPEVRAKLSSRAKARMLTPEGAANMLRAQHLVKSDKPSKAEIRLGLLLAQSGNAGEWHHTGQDVSERVGTRWPDWKNTARRLIIEVDGHFHNPDRDARWDADVGALGWRVLRINAGDIASDPDGVVRRIKDFVRSASLR